MSGIGNQVVLIAKVPLLAIASTGAVLGGPARFGVTDDSAIWIRVSPDCGGVDGDFLAEVGQFAFERVSESGQTGLKETLMVLKTLDEPVEGAPMRELIQAAYKA